MSDQFREHVEMVRDCMDDERLPDVDAFGVDRAMSLTSRMQARGLLADYPPALDPNRVTSAITFLLGQVHLARLGREEITADTVELAAQSMRQGLRGRDTGDGGNLGSRDVRLHDAMFEMVTATELAKLAEIGAGMSRVEDVVSLITHFADMHREVAMNVDARTGQLYPDPDSEEAL